MLQDVGKLVLRAGNITTLNWIGARQGHLIAQNLGFRPTRLDEGYAILLLKSSLQVGEFEFEGTTLRSGGRFGLPAHSEAADGMRRRVHDDLIDELGPVRYREWQQRVLADTTTFGERRIAKVVPQKTMPGPIDPSHEYPPGGGGLQWKLVKPKSFLCALYVDRNGLATAPNFSVPLGANASLQDRMKVHQWLISA